MAATPDEELLNILKSQSDSAVKICALDCVLGLTGSAEGTEHILESKDYLQTICKLFSNHSNNFVAEKALKCLINLTADEQYVQKVTEACPELVSDLVKTILSGTQCVQLALMVFANVTRLESICEETLKIVTAHGGLRKFVELLNSNINRDLYDFTAMVLSNLSRGSAPRRELMCNDLELLRILLPFTIYPDSGVRRLGVVATIRNCCFDMEYHPSLLKDDCGLLSAICLPLAGPEDLDDDEMEKLPLELQYLGEDKKRDSDPQIRKMCIEALNQLCATKQGRSALREKGIYYILRELHKSETDRSTSVACENVVDILIGDEPEPQHSNLKEIQVSPELEDRFNKMNTELLKDD